MDHQKFVKVAAMSIGSRYFSEKPWEYLNYWQNSDRGYDPDEMTTINQKMQERYPGPYKVVKKTSPYGRFTYYEMEFGSPAEETMYKLKWA